MEVENERYCGWWVSNPRPSEGKDSEVGARDIADGGVRTRDRAIAARLGPLTNGNGEPGDSTQAAPPLWRRGPGPEHDRTVRTSFERAAQRDSESLTGPESLYTHLVTESH